MTRKIISLALSVSLALYGCADRPTGGSRVSASPASAGAKSPMALAPGFPRGTLAMSFEEETGLDYFD